MFSRYQIEFDAKSVLESLDLTDRDMNKIARKMMSGAFQAVRRDIRKGLKGSILKRRTGRLYRNITYKADNNYNGFLRIGTYYAGILEKGATILPKKKNYLRFQIDGSWVTLKKVVLPARPFSKPAFDSYFGMPYKADGIMDSIMQRELEKIFSKE